jgi:hypothetical protein
MSSLRVETLWLAITQIEAQQILAKLVVADWPNLKKDERSKKHRELHRLAYPSLEKKKSITPQDLQRILARGR